MAKLAVPPLKVAVSRSVELSKNSTCPLGVARPGVDDEDENVAVNVTDSV